MDINFHQICGPIICIYSLRHLIARSLPLIVASNTKRIRSMNCSCCTDPECSKFSTNYYYQNTLIFFLQLPVISKPLQSFTHATLFPIVLRLPPQPPRPKARNCPNKYKICKTMLAIGSPTDDPPPTSHYIKIREIHTKFFSFPGYSTAKKHQVE